jgi:hypothetical protein
VNRLKPEYDPDSEDISFSTDCSYTIQSAAVSGDSIILSFQEAIDEGKIQVTINALGTEAETAIRDYAGNKVSKQDVTFHHTNDGSLISEVTVKQAKYNSVTLSFSKPVTAKNIALFHGDKNIAANMSTPVSINDGDFVDEITFAFDPEIPAGPATLFLVNSPEPDEKMFNIFGEYVSDQEFAAVVAGDTDTPYVIGSELINANCFVIYFNERVSRSFAENPENYDVNDYDMDNNNVYYTTVSFIPKLSSDEKSVELYFPKGLRDNTKYNVIVSNAEDILGNKKTSDIPLEFTCGERSMPSIAVNKCFTNNKDGKIMIFFSEPMDEDQMLDKSNYKVAATSGESYASLEDGDIISKLSARSILIDLSYTVDTPSVMISPIMDLNGNSLYNSIAPVYLNDIDVQVLRVESADLIAKNKVKVTFNGILESYNSSDIYFPGVIKTETEQPLVESMINNDNDKTEVVLVLNKELSTDVKYNGSVVSAVTKADSRSKSILGTILSPSQTITINDMVPPELITYDQDSDPLTDSVEKVILSGNILSQMDENGNVSKNTTGTITITYSEPILEFSLSVLTYSVAGYTVTSISNAINKNEVVLSIKANSNNTPARTITVRQVYNISDYSNNILFLDKVLTVR